MTDEKAPVEKAVELFVYAPVGMALYVRDMLPSMMGIFVSRGRRELQSHRTPPAPPVTPPPLPDEVRRRIDESVGVARVVAEGGFGVARDVAGSGIGVARGMAGSALQSFLAMRTPDGGGAADTMRSPSSDPTPTDAAPLRSAPTPPSDASPTGPVPSVESLPIPDYDELSASQVVERLEGLDRDSLRAIRDYETGHRGRKTILGKIAQLT